MTTWSSPSTFTRWRHAIVLARRRRRELGIELSRADGSASMISLSGRNDAATAAFQLLLRGAGEAEPQKVTWRVLEPADVRLRVLDPAPTRYRAYSADAIHHQRSR